MSECETAFIAVGVVDGWIGKSLFVKQQHLKCVSVYVVSSRLRPHFTPSKFPYPFFSRLGGPQGQSGQSQKISSPPDFNPRTIQYGSLVAIPTELPVPLSPNFLLFLLLLPTQLCHCRPPHQLLLPLILIIIIIIITLIYFNLVVTLWQ